MSQAAASDWKQRPEGGGRFAIWLIRSVGRYGGRALGRACLYPITLYFLVRRGPERRASRAWLQAITGRPASLLAVARHIHTFAATILDRIFLLSGQLHRFDIQAHGLDKLEQYLESGEGVLLFGSHLGSFEVLRVLARSRPDARLRVVLDKGHNPAMTELLDALDPGIAATVIDAGQDGATIMLEVQQAIAGGQMVALLVDRAQPGEPALSTPFVGMQAPFPLAPWQLAAVLPAPYPVSTSSPVPPDRTSEPSPPLRMSLPPSPASRSAPKPPSALSLPRPPASRSLPARPDRTSSPPLPKMRSS